MPAHWEHPWMLRHEIVCTQLVGSTASELQSQDLFKSMLKSFHCAHTAPWRHYQVACPSLHSPDPKLNLGCWTTHVTFLYNFWLSKMGRTVSYNHVIWSYIPEHVLLERPCRLSFEHLTPLQELIGRSGEKIQGVTGTIADKLCRVVDLKLLPRIKQDYQQDIS